MILLTWYSFSNHLSFKCRKISFSCKYPKLNLISTVKLIIIKNVLIYWSWLKSLFITEFMSMSLCIKLFTPLIFMCVSNLNASHATFNTYSSSYLKEKEHQQKKTLYSGSQFNFDLLNELQKHFMRSNDKGRRFGEVMRWFFRVWWSQNT